MQHFLNKKMNFERIRSELEYHNTIHKMRDMRQYSNIGQQLHNQLKSNCNVNNSSAKDGPNENRFSNHTDQKDTKQKH